MRSDAFRACAGELLVLCTSLLLSTAWEANAIIGTAYQMQLGNPSGASAEPTNHNHYLIERTVEVIDYSDNLGQPNWVSWDLTAADIGDSGRSSSFYTDTNLPATFYALTEGDYSGSGYNRGHMCPSMDRTDTSANNRLVFYMSNIVPQTSENNGGPWASLEVYCQTLAKAGNELLILCGPGGFSGARLQPGEKAAIPGYVWKIVVVVPPGTGMATSRITAATRVIAVKIPNTTDVGAMSWTSFVTSANQLQNDTGLTFFTALSPEIATVLRAVVDGTSVPGITGFTPASGITGTAVLITGTNFSSASQVTFNGVNAAFSVDSSTRITATVPAGTSSGPIRVLTAGGTANSTNAFLITGPAYAAVTVQPSNQMAYAGGVVSFSVQATGAEPLGFQWWKGATPIADGGRFSGVSTATLTVSNVTAADAAGYCVVVTNNLNAVTSSVAALVLYQPATTPRTVIAQWNFNNTSSPVASPSATAGSGTVTLVGGTTSAWVSGSGSTDTNASNGAWNTLTYAAQGTGNKSCGVQFNVSTRGYRDIAVSWDQRLSSTASRLFRLQSSLDGILFSNGPVVALTTTGAFQSKSNSWAGVAGANDNPTFAFRLVAEFESTALETANAGYVTASTSSYGTGGTVRYDMVTVTGCPIPAAASLQVIASTPNRLDLQLQGTSGCRYALESSTNLTDWLPVTTNTAPFVFTDTPLPSATVRFYRALSLP